MAIDENYDMIHIFGNTHLYISFCIDYYESKKKSRVLEYYIENQFNSKILEHPNNL